MNMIFVFDIICYTVAANKPNPYGGYRNEKVSEKQADRRQPERCPDPAGRRQGALLCVHQRRGDAGSLIPCFSAAQRLRYCLGVSPVAFRNTLIKWLWEQKARKLAISEQS